MGIRNLFRRKTKAAKEPKSSKKAVVEEDKLPTEGAMPEKVSAEPTEEPIEEERDDTTLETDDEPTTEAETEKAAEDVKSSEKSKFGCCEPEVFQNLQAAVGMST